MRIFRAIIALVIGALSISLASASLVTEVDWADLAPGYNSQSNPFYGLDERESMLLGMIVRVERARSEGRELTDLEVVGEDLAIKALDSVGKDAHDLVRRVISYDDFLEVRGKRTATAMDGALISVSGFVLPVNVEGQKITQFILVPFAGACVHTPAPPPNLMIAVESEQGFQINGRFESVTVTGILEIAPEQHEIPFTDGVSHVETAYSLTADSVDLVN